METYSSTFTASVQYGDWRGTCKADDADRSDLRDRLRELNLIRDGEFVVGLTMFNGENRGGELTPAGISALLVEAPNYEGAKRALDAPDPLKVRQVRFEMSVEEFFSRFKRFSIALAWQDLDMVGREFTAYTEVEKPEARR